MNLLLLQRHDYDTTRGFQDKFFFVYSTVFFVAPLLNALLHGRFHFFPVTKVENLSFFSSYFFLFILNLKHR